MGKNTSFAAILLCVCKVLLLVAALYTLPVLFLIYLHHSCAIGAISREVSAAWTFLCCFYGGAMLHVVFVLSGDWIAECLDRPYSWMQI